MTVIDFRADGFDGGHAYDDEPAGRTRYRAGGDDTAHAYYTTVGHDGGSIAGRITRLLNYLAAVVSVGLMVGLMVWGYRLVTRDVSGVPVIQAITGEARTLPEDPGGELAEEKGLAVNAVAAGNAPERIASVTLGTGSAVLTDADVAMGELGATARAPGPLSEIAPDAQVAAIVATPDAERLAADLPADSVAVSEATDMPAAQAGAPADRDEAIAQAVAEAAMPAIARTARPQPRPARLVRLAAAPAAVVADTSSAVITVAEAPAPAPKVEPARTAAPGSTVAQIGAFDSDAIARSEWTRIAGKNAGLFAGKSPIVQKTEKAGRTFWRLRVAGFDSREEARDFCTGLKAGGTDCIATVAN